MRKAKQHAEEPGTVYHNRKDLLVEEFPEGPYGSTVYLDQPIGKSSPWQSGQHVTTRYQDENPAFSDRTVPTSTSAEEAHDLD